MRNFIPAFHQMDSVIVVPRCIPRTINRRGQFKDDLAILQSSKEATEDREMVSLGGVGSLSYSEFLHPTSEGIGMETKNFRRTFSSPNRPEGFL